MAIEAGVIGLGWSGFEMHCRTLQELPEFNLVAGVDTDPKLRQRAEQELGIRTYASLEHLLENEKVDCLSVCVPSYLHFDVGKQVLEAGVNLIMEKPVALRTRDVDKLIVLASRQGLMLTVFNNRRWYANFVAVRQVLEKREIGDPVLIESRVTFFGIPGGADKNSWRNQAVLGGGVLYDWGAHLFDQVILLAGEPPATVYCIIKDDFYRTDADDYFKAILTFPSGLTAQVEMNSISDISLPAWYIVGTRGSVISDMDNIWGKTTVSTGSRGNVKRYYAPRPETGDYMDVAKLFYGKVAKTLNDGEPPPVLPQDARRVTRLIEYCLQSDREGSVVRCDEFFDKSTQGR